jgi:hypothetical protein
MLRIFAETQLHTHRLGGQEALLASASRALHSGYMKLGDQKKTWVSMGFQTEHEITNPLMLRSLMRTHKGQTTHQQTNQRS